MLSPHPSDVPHRKRDKTLARIQVDPRALLHHLSLPIGLCKTSLDIFADHPAAVSSQEAVENDELSPDELETFAHSIWKSLVAQAGDLRSQIVHKACLVIESFSIKLKGKFRDTAKLILQPLIGDPVRPSRISLFLRHSILGRM